MYAGCARMRIWWLVVAAVFVVFCLAIDLFLSLLYLEDEDRE